MPVKLDEDEIFEGRWEGVEGTLVNGVAGGEMVGVIDVAKLQVDVTSPQYHEKYYMKVSAKYTYRKANH